MEKEMIQKPSYKIASIYLINCVTNVLINFDHGIIPAATKEMKTDLNIDDFLLGILGSAVYCGLVVGSVLGSHFFNIYSTKKIVIVSVLGCMGSLSLFLITKNIIILFISRFLVGFFQIFLVVFFPVWIDFYGGIKKTLWLTFTQLGVALGAVAGYVVTSMFITHSGNWVQPYELQIFLMLPCLLFYICCEESELDTSGNQMHQIDDQFKNLNHIERLQFIMENKIFKYTMLGLSSLFFVVNGIQFWVSDYFRNVLNVPQEVVFKAYMFVSLTAPILGVMVGGLVLHVSGGYDGDNALKIATYQALFASLCATPIPFLDSFLLTIIMLWLLLFFGGCIVPGVTGVMISSIPANSRSYGNAISHIFQELLGYLPSPMLYGFVVMMTGGNTSRYGMLLLTTWSYLGLICIWLAQREQQQLVEKLHLNETGHFPQITNLSSIQKPDNEIQLIRPRHQSYTPADQFEDQLEPNRRVSTGHIPFNQHIFTDISMSMGVSQQLHPFSRAASVDYTYLQSPRTILNRELKRKGSMMQVVEVFANMVGRASIDINIGRNQQVRQEKVVELQVQGLQNDQKHQQ